MPFLLAPTRDERAKADAVLCRAWGGGAWFGLRIFKRLSDRQFQLAVNLLLIASGGGLIV